jgi:hypothetical protein
LRRKQCLVSGCCTSPTIEVGQSLKAILSRTKLLSFNYSNFHAWFVMLGTPNALFTYKQTNSVALSVQANYIDWATATADEVVPIFADRGCCCQQNWSLSPLISIFYTGAAILSFK